MYQDSSCRGSPQPTPTPSPPAAANETESISVADSVDENQQTEVTTIPSPTLTPTQTPAPTQTPTDLLDEQSSQQDVVAVTVADEATSVATTSNATTIAEVSVPSPQNDDEDALSGFSESSSDSEYIERSSQRPSTTSTNSTSTATTTTTTPSSTDILVGGRFPRAPSDISAERKRRRARNCDVNSDVRLLRKIGYIASRVRFLAKIYGDFKLVNPYSPAKQRRLLHEIKLKHSIIDPAKELTRSDRSATPSRSHSLTPASSVASSYCCLPTESSADDETVLTPGAVRRKSSSSLLLLEDLLVQIYEDRRNKITVIRRRRSGKRRNSASAGGSGSGGYSTALATTCCGSSNRKHLIIMSSKTTSSSVERLLQLGNDNESDAEGSIGGGGGGGSIAGGIYNLNVTTTSSQQTQQQQQHHIQQRSHSNAFLQPISINADDNQRRRRASDCSPLLSHPVSQMQQQQQQQHIQQLGNQLQVTLKNNNCTKFPFHRGSCGAASEHLLAANSIANRSTIILSKSCGNVDGSAGGVIVGGNGATTKAALYASNFVTSKTGNGNGNIGSGGGVGGGGVGGGGVMSASVGSTAATVITTTTTAAATTTSSATATGTSATNGNGNDYSIVQLNNTIIQCHFNDDDFRALVKDLKRKVEYTERMNWLCLSKRPMGPPHRKSSLPKHQEVKKRFLEICDTTFSDEVKSALRLPAFDSYAWSDADVIHLMQTMFIELGFIDKFMIPVDTLREWLYEVYKHYNEVPFHNFRHCFCVAQMMYAITRQANLLQRLGHLECLILLVSCICHDLDHPGYNNIYQINARTELALRYNDISPLENHHCSIAFRLLEHPECNIFKNFSRDTFNQIREGIIRCILATDMARHNEILTQFKEITPIFDYSNRAHINLLCMVLIKVADISNEARPMDVAEPWLDRLLQEFFAQSAAEKSEGLPVTPFMDPDKVSKPGSQVRFIGLVLLPLFEALGDLVPEVIDLIIIPVRIALDYYKRLNDAQGKSRRSVPDAAASENVSGSSDAATAFSTGTASSTATVGSMSGSNAGVGGGGGGGGGGGSGGGNANSGGSISPQMPRSQSGISVKSRRSIPSQKSASRTSVDEPQCIAAELHDLPEGSESGDSETATEVDVAEKTSKFKVDTEGSSSRSKSSHSTSRKSSREKRPSMIGEMCSSGGGQRIRNSYGNIHGYHSSNRNHFGSNRAVSLDQYSTNNRRLSDGLQQVISDSNVFYNRHNRGSLETAPSGCRLTEDRNMNASAGTGPAGHGQAGTYAPHYVPINENTTAAADCIVGGPLITSVANATSAAALSTITASNGNLSPTQAMPPPPKQHCCAAAAAAAAAATIVSSAANSTSNGVAAASNGASGVGGAASSAKPSWKARLKQFSDYIGFSFDKNTKRFGSTRSSPCSVRNNNATTQSLISSGGLDPHTGKAGVCCTISNNLQSPGGLRHKPTHHELISAAGRHRAYSLDVPCSRSNPRYSSSSAGGGDSSRKSSRHDGGGTGDDNNSNNTLHSSGTGGGEMPTCLPPPIRIGSVDASDTILIATGLPRVITPAHLVEPEPSLSIDLGMASGSSSEAPKI